MCHSKASIATTNAVTPWQFLGATTDEGLAVKSIVLLQVVARSCEERYQQVNEKLQALKKVKKKLGNLEEEIGSLHDTNKVRLAAQ